MSGRGRRRVSDVLTGLAACTFPRNREGDARAVRDCAREAVHAEGLRRLPHEASRSQQPECARGPASR